MDLETLSAELERLFELDELKHVSSALLGFEPEHIGGSTARAAFARALTQHCVRADAVEALLDAVIAWRPEAHPKLLALRRTGVSFFDELSAGDSLADLVLVKELGRGARSASYQGRGEGRDVRVKVLTHEASLDRSGVQRYLTATRLASGLEHPGLPSGVFAGVLDETSGRVGVVHDYVEGESLAAWLRRVGPVPFADLRGLLEGVLEALQALHEQRLCHGALSLENVLFVSDLEWPGRVILLDAGANQVRVFRPREANRAASARSQNGHGGLNGASLLGASSSMAPEQIRGEPADARSDLYALGAVIFELVSGKPPFSGQDLLHALVGHLERPAPPLRSVTDAGVVSPGLEEFVLSLLQKDPAARPRDARMVLDRIAQLGRASVRVGPAISAEDVSERFARLLQSPWDEDEAASLEAAEELGADPLQLAEGFYWLAGQLEHQPGPAMVRSRRRMLFRAARLYESGAGQPEVAEPILLSLVESDPGDQAALAALEKVRRRLGKHEELVEMLLERSELVEAGSERAQVLAQIGELYEKDLHDSEQALVAYTQAFVEDPDDPEHALSVERLAGTQRSAWEEVLSSAIEAVNEERTHESRTKILLKMGQWYTDKVGRPDLALPWYNAVLETEPENDAALAGLGALFKKAQQWAELGQVLLRRANVSAGSLSRNLRVEAAEILERQMGDQAGARNLYEAVFDEDPSSEAACTALQRLYERTNDVPSLLRVLERRADALGGQARVQALLKIAELYEDQDGDLEQSLRRYGMVLEEEPDNLDALRGQDRVLNRLGRYPELLSNLERQLAVSVTARQKIGLYQRIAGIYEEEFLDPTRAAEAMENVLSLDAEHEEALNALARYYRALERFRDVALVLGQHVELATGERRVEKALELGQVRGEKLGQVEEAIEAFEIVLAEVPNHPAALEALARLRSSSGDAERALEAIEALAREASDPQEKAEQHVRAGRLLEERNDVDGALERYKRAVDSTPGNAKFSKILRDAYVRHGDAAAAVELLERELDHTEGERARGMLAGEMARLCYDELFDAARAEDMGRLALELDPTNLDALSVLGHVAYADGRYVEASKRYEQVVRHVASMTREQGMLVYMSYVDALSKSGSGARALEVAEELLSHVPEDRGALMRAAEVFFEHGPAPRAFDLYNELVARFSESFDRVGLARLYYRLGESARKIPDLKRAKEALERSLELDPQPREAYRSMAELYEARGDWETVIKIRYRELDTVSGDERTNLLIEIGDLAASKLSDPSYAARSYLTALSERPKDRKIMMKLMQLYSEGKDWPKLLKVILRLASFVDDPKQKAKYLHTAAMVASRELGDEAQAAELLNQALRADPSLDSAIAEALRMRFVAGDYEGCKGLFKLRIKNATEAGDNPLLLQSLDQLAELYLTQLRRPDQAVAVLESAKELDPENAARNAKLMELYLADPARHLERAAVLLDTAVLADPFSPAPYQMLRQLYTQARRPDGAYCACQALFVMNRANPDEVRFFSRLRPESPPSAQSGLSDDDWLSLVMPKESEPLLTAVMALVQTAVVATRAQEPAALGYGEEHRIDPDTYPYGVVYAVRYAAQVLGVNEPLLFHNPNDAGLLSFLETKVPATVVGAGALNESLSGAMVTAVAARHLTYLRPGFYVRHLVPTVTGLKAWLFAAVKSINPQFPISADLHGPVRDALQALETRLTQQHREHLASVVSRLLSQEGALDLKRWVASVDKTADRVSLILGDDLESSVELIRATELRGAATSANDRISALLAYSVSQEYLALREQLGISISA